MTIQVGDQIPNIHLSEMTESGPSEVTADQLFKGRRVVLFSVPGAFTPTCSNQHLPGFIAQHDQITAKGVDQIACLAVNDAFVMGAWGKDQGAGDAVRMLADGNADFTKALGLDADASAWGMGIRGQRFAMVVSDGVVEGLHIDPPGSFELTSAEHILSTL